MVRETAPPPPSGRFSALRNELERVPADRVVSEAWRLRRAVAFEARVIASKTAEMDANRQEYTAICGPKPPPDAGAVVLDLLREDVLTKLSRYDRRIERSMYRAMAELRRLPAESLPEGEWIDAEEGKRTRETKPKAENSENRGPVTGKEEEFEDENEGTGE